MGGHSYPQLCIQLIRSPKNQREQISRAPSASEERKVCALKGAGPWDVTAAKTGVCFWRVGSKHTQDVAVEETGLSTGDGEGFDLLCVASIN